MADRRPEKGPAVPQLNPAILSWARETAGLTPEAAVTKLGLGDARGVEAIDRLAALESGEAVPTRAMLSKMARQYRRPLVTFYLARPPRRSDWGKDFRAPMTDGGPEARRYRPESLFRSSDSGRVGHLDHRPGGPS